MFWIPIAMAAAGAAKGHLDQKAAQKKREAEAVIAQWAPWTGMSAQRVDDGPGVLGGAMQGGMSGLAMGQSMDESEARSAAMNRGSGASMTGGAAEAPQDMTNSRVQPTQPAPMQNSRITGPSTLMGQNQYDQYGNPMGQRPWYGMQQSKSQVG